MYIRMRIYIYIYIYTCMYIYIYIHTYTDTLTWWFAEMLGGVLSSFRRAHTHLRVGIVK